MGCVLYCTVRTTASDLDDGFCVLVFVLIDRWQLSHVIRTFGSELHVYKQQTIGGLSKPFRDLVFSRYNTPRLLPVSMLLCILPMCVAY